MLFYTIQDLPTLGNTSGQTVKGFKACVTCMENTEIGVKPRHLSGIDLFKKVNDVNVVLSKGPKKRER